VDQAGTVLDSLGQRRREKRAAPQFFRQLLTGFTDVPRVLIPDTLQSYAAAQRELLPGGNLASLGI
jgi:putative transposase